MGADKIVIYKNYENPIEAQITLTRLRDAGFECFLSGENTAWLRPMLDSSISGIQLHVFEKDIPEISRFLQEDLPLEE
ncbi:hypothetical protein [Pedobacter sp.]|uniref:hypothetical protein n=1 Tax=Pedobacter sp. TaxID=1411316 RepID=UPI00396CABC2